MRKKNLLQKFPCEIEVCYRQFFYQAIDMAVSCICNKFQQIDHIERLQTMEILLLKASCEEDIGHELQQMSSFDNSDLHKFKLET